MIQQNHELPRKEIQPYTLEKKYHNISHLKEFGIIFVIPLPIDTAGETTRMFTLLLHYLHEVPFYSDLFRKYSTQPDFVSNFKSLLRGDIPTGPIPENGKINWVGKRMERG